MLYLLFLALAVTYNFRKFGKERDAILSSLIEAKNDSHRQMILSHHFYIFIFECFISVVVAHFMSERAMVIGMLGLGGIYLGLLFIGFGVFQLFVRHLEKQTELELVTGFRRHIVQEVRVNFALIMLPILIYSIINMTFQDGIYEEWGQFWFIGLLFNIMFVSVLTIVCSVIIMLKLIPNREITEPEYLEIINHRLEQIGMPNLRVRWIETDVKNAFVAGLKLFRFSNQTMFVGKRLRQMLTLEEFDAVISHELSHVANRHIHKRVIDLLKNFLSVMTGTGLIMVLVIGGTFLYWGEDASLHTGSTAILAAVGTLLWIVFNFAFLFDTIRSHEFEADAYAVMELGAGLAPMKSALEKLTAPEELPDYLKNRSRHPDQKTWFSKYFGHYFTTHPDLATRIQSLEHKIREGLPYNYYVSSAQRARALLGSLFHWKILAPTSAVFALTLTWTITSYRSGLRTIASIDQSPVNSLMERHDLASLINKRPTLVGPTLMYYIVKKGDSALIDHYVKEGAEKGRTLLYLAQNKDLELFEHYYRSFHQDISDEEYFLILRKTAQVQFTEGYRLLVNAERFESLHPAYKHDISALHNRGDRLPASVKEE